ncbi:MAG: hypothetical protein M3083_15050 [Actinomycetota bacterium]|nr:hypothetical protein [Actinomycetota bacterium]
MADTEAGFSCLLPARELADRARTWRGLAPLVLGRERVNGGFRIHFEPLALPHLESLVAAERDCCGWATWTVGSDESSAIFEVKGPSGPLDALAAGFGL